MGPWDWTSHWTGQGRPSADQESILVLAGLLATVLAICSTLLEILKNFKIAFSLTFSCSLKSHEFLIRFFRRQWGDRHRNS